MATTSDILVTLPWRPKELSPNSRCHWRARAVVVRRIRYQSAWLTREAMMNCLVNFDPDEVTRVNVQLEFTPPDRRPRDEDNLIASMKPYVDGMADALRVNDKKFHYKEITFAKPHRPGCITAHISLEVKHGANGA